jgi:deoxyribose-phosphate aldolase
VDINKIRHHRLPADETIQQRIAKALGEVIPPISDQGIAGLADLAILNAEQSQTSLEYHFSVLKKHYEADSAFRFAGVCVYPNHITLAKDHLKNSKTKVVAVTGNFPSGQTLLKSKLTETRLAIDSGADEIDYVFNRSALTDKAYDKITEELSAVREVCGSTPLKIILESGEMKDMNEVYIATELALQHGANFIKTSTGKTAVGATLEAAYIMINAIKAHWEKEGKKVGIKLSGGIANRKQIKQYIQLTNSLLGNQWVDSNLFRIGLGKFGFDLLEQHKMKGHR